MPEWIPYDKHLPRKAETFRLANALSISRREAVALCLEVWAWADSETADGNIPGLQPADLDEITGTPGTGDALVEAGWLIADKEGLIFPNFDRFNTAPAKRRLRDADRKRRARTAGQPGSGDNKP